MLNVEVSRDVTCRAGRSSSFHDVIVGLTTCSMDDLTSRHSRLMAKLKTSVLSAVPRVAARAKVPNSVNGQLGDAMRLISGNHGTVEPVVQVVINDLPQSGTRNSLRSIDVLHECASTSTPASGIHDVMRACMHG